MSVPAVADWTGAFVGVRDHQNSVFTEERVHIATFDADQSDPSYNAINCEAIREREDRMAITEGRPIRYWCERGTTDPSVSLPTALRTLRVSLSP